MTPPGPFHGRMTVVSLPFPLRPVRTILLLAATFAAAGAPCRAGEAGLSLAAAMQMRETGGAGSAVEVARAVLALAAAGDSAAQYALARICERGEGLKAPAPQKAVFWADRAAAGGDVDARVLLGLYWAAGFGVDRDVEAARRCFARAAAAGDPLGAALLLAAGGEGEGAAALAPSCTLGDLAAFADLVARAGLLEKLLSGSGFSGAVAPEKPPVFRAGREPRSFPASGAPATPSRQERPASG